MASHTKEDDYCLECQWEGLRLDGKNSEDVSGVPASHWDCPVVELDPSQTHCEADEICCDDDNCSITCPSVCDGFVDCEDSAACSVTHCEDTDCQDIVPVCFDEHCFGTNIGDADHTDHTLESLLGLGIPMGPEKNELLPSVPVEQSEPGHVAAEIADSSLCTSAFFNPDSIAITHCSPHNFHHFPCHDFSLPTQEPLIHQPSPIQNEINPAEVFHMLGMCPDFSNHFHVHQAANCPDSLDGNINGTPDTNSFTCLHLDQDSVNNLMKNTLHMSSGSLPARGPCRSAHRCRPHTHAHVHPYSPFSRHSRSSFSSQLLSSPGETPPPLDGGLSSGLTSPDFSPADPELHVCKWTTNSRGIKIPCGASFPDSRALQEHLISRHMGTVDGPKGIGYYCCWQGCCRPDEPFSQKSKLQGHFLTHSNYKNFQCSVCGKLFARQATLERHERSHRGEKPYKCAECGKSFTDSSELKTHSRTHTGEKPFKCPYPGCKFETGDLTANEDIDVKSLAAAKALPDLTN